MQHDRNGTDMIRDFCISETVQQYSRWAAIGIAQILDRLRLQGITIKKIINHGTSSFSSCFPDTFTISLEKQVHDLVITPGRKQFYCDMTLWKNEAVYTLHVPFPPDQEAANG
jgi:hypothetical protein